MMRKILMIAFPILCVALVLGTMILLNNMDKKVEETLQSQYSNTTDNSVYESEEENVTNVETENEVTANNTVVEGYSVPLE